MTDRDGETKKARRKADTQRREAKNNAVKDDKEPENEAKEAQTKEHLRILSDKRTQLISHSNVAQDARWEETPLEENTGKSEAEPDIRLRE
ncbi:hypothetical protein E2C01_089985 [Portunus trituberculatus]|uniref:Uncharacterized protein n=1 Tax=Portunus trituberculatus TaxID=210409 RepID=A0A5B7JJ28_PORTR|nr:hypothetical protein [Portunus trituberculatus]